MAVERIMGHGHPLEGREVTLPGGDRALVLSVEHEWDDGTTLRYVSGPQIGSLTMRDTYAIRKYAGLPPTTEGVRSHV